MRFLVKHPPKGDDILDRPQKGSWDPCILPALSEHATVATKIECCETEFLESGNPLCAVYAFQLATDARVYPPLWVLKFLNDCFGNLAVNGNSLDLAFGLSRAGKGKWITPAKEFAYARRNKQICIAVFKYEAIGMSRNAACETIASLSINDNGEETLSGAAVRKILKEAEHRYKREKQVIQDAAKSWTDDDKRQVLSNVNTAVLPRNIRKELKT